METIESSSGRPNKATRRSIKNVVLLVLILSSVAIVSYLIGVNHERNIDIQRVAHTEELLNKQADVEKRQFPVLYGLIEELGAQYGLAVGYGTAGQATEKVMALLGQHVTYVAQACDILNKADMRAAELKENLLRQGRNYDFQKNPDIFVMSLKLRKDCERYRSK